jgi:hypothetical protein
MKKLNTKSVLFEVPNAEGSFEIPQLCKFNKTNLLERGFASKKKIAIWGKPGSTYFAIRFSFGKNIHGIEKSYIVFMKYLQRGEILKTKKGYGINQKSYHTIATDIKTAVTRIKEYYGISLGQSGWIRNNISYKCRGELGLEGWDILIKKYFENAGNFKPLNLKISQ